MQTENNIETKNTSRNYKLPLIILLIILAFAGGFVFGSGKLKINGKLQITKGNPPTSQSADYNLLWNVLDQLNSKFVDRPLDQQKLLYGAISGLVNAAGDPYTTFFDPNEAKQFADQLKGSFEGIGAEVGTKNDQIIVVAPLDDSPAQKAGLLAGDAIIAVNGESTSGMTVDTAVSKIRGSAGTDVTLTILHAGRDNTEDIKITRGEIVMKSVKLTEQTVNGKKIAVIKLSQFGDDTKDLFEQAVEKVLANGDTGLILDLRNNPGGYLNTAVDVASYWIDNGDVVVKEQDYNDNVTDYKASGSQSLKGIKTIVLVNGGSASASEILSGALQDYKLATLVGEKTFGKGSVQELSNLPDNSEVKITVAKWLTPNGRGINHVGLDPDVKTELTAQDAESGKDPQMDKALELLK